MNEGFSKLGCIYRQIHSLVKIITPDLSNNTCMNIKAKFDGFSVLIKTSKLIVHNFCPMLWSCLTVFVFLCACLYTATRIIEECGIAHVLFRKLEKSVLIFGENLRIVAVYGLTFSFKKQFLRVLRWKNLKFYPSARFFFCVVDEMFIKVS